MISAREDDERAAAEQHARDADREEDRGDREVPGDARPEHSAPSASTQLLVLRAHPEHDAADRGDEQHDRRDLEGEQVVGEEQPADLGGRAERATDVRLVREAVRRRRA